MKIIRLILIKLLDIRSPSLTMIPGLKDIPDMTYSELWSRSRRQTY